MFGAHRKRPPSQPMAEPCAYSPRVSSDTACPTADHSERFHVAPTEITCGKDVGQPVDVYSPKLTCSQMRRVNIEAGGPRLLANALGKLLEWQSV